MLTTLNSFKLATASESASSLEQVVLDLQALEAQLPATDRVVTEIMQRFVNALVNLCKWVQCSLNGEPQSERFLNAAKGQAIIAEELVPLVRFQNFADNVRQIITAIKAVNQFDDIKGVMSAVARTPVPILCLREDEGRWSARNATDDESAKPKNEGPFVIKVMFDIARQPWSNQQILLAETLHDVHAKITIPVWPEETDYLFIDYISTLLPEHYKLSPIRIDRPQNDELTEFDWTGHAEFPVAQHLLSEPIVIRVRATFSSASDNKLGIPATIIGYHQLRVRVSDKTHTPLLSGYKAIDARIETIVNDVRQSLSNVDLGHLSDFIEALSAIANYLGINLQQALYKQGTGLSEPDFQHDLLIHLRSILGEEVQEAPRQAGGPTDIKYRSVTIELKVEDRISDRRKMIDKYCAQLVQYSSGSGAQLGILCILDQTEKHTPLANSQNQIVLVTPPVHGFPDGDAPYPTKIAAVVIDGKMRLPSSYSR